MTAKKADFILLALAIVWGSGYSVTKFAVAITSPIQFLTWRFVISSILSLILFRKRFVEARKDDWIAGGIIGLCLVSGILIQTYGLKYTGAGKAVFIASAFVIMVPFFFWVMSGERPKLKIIIACIIMLVGFWLLTMGTGSFSGWNKGDSLILISAVGFALHTSVIGVFAPKKDPLLLSGIQFIVCGVIFSILSIFDGGRQPITLEALLAILYSAIIITFLCHLTQVICQKYTQPSRAAIIINLESIFGTLIAIAFLKESYSGIQIFSFALVFAAVLIAEVGREQKSS